MVHLQKAVLQADVGLLLEVFEQAVPGDLSAT